MGAGFVLIIWLCIAAVLGLAVCVLAGAYIIAHKKKWQGLRYLLIALVTPLVITLGLIALGGVVFFAVVFDVGAIRWAPPTVSSIQGFYQISDDSRRWLTESKGYRSLDTTVTVDPDRHISLSLIPDCVFDGFGESNGKELSGHGIFEIEKEYGCYYDLVLNNSEATSEIFRNLSLRIMRGGDLRITIGDPDSAEYIYFKKKS